MTAKEYLEQLITLDKEISRKQQRLVTLRDIVMNTTPAYEEEVVQHSRILNPFENIMAKIIDLDREINEDIDRLVDLKAEVWEQLDRLSDERLKRILWLKYAEMKTWNYIAADVNITRRHAIRLHKLGLDEFEKNFKI
ncbi:MAG: RNA polymerase subunit sigma-24 [Clostridia bacterium]|nr:RNA polymerase subunit sigma-24 [Clostridia bacterium]